MHKRYTAVLTAAAVLLLAASLCLLIYFNPFVEKIYTPGDFGIDTVYSTVDFNGNGTDDYTDILLGARADAKITRYTIRLTMTADIRRIT